VRNSESTQSNAFKQRRAECRMRIKIMYSLSQCVMKSANDLATMYS